MVLCVRWATYIKKSVNDKYLDCVVRVLHKVHPQIVVNGRRKGRSERGQPKDFEGFTGCYRFTDQREPHQVLRHYVALV